MQSDEYNKYKKIVFLFSFFILFSFLFSYSYNYKRVISLAPNITDILLYLNLKNKLVGVARYSYIKDRDIEIIDSYSLDYEKIISLKPDLILVNKDIKTFFYDKLKNFNLNVKEFSFKQLTDIYTSIISISELFNKKDKGIKLVNSIKNEIFNLRKKKIFKGKKIVFIVSLYPLYVYGKGTYLSELIGENPFNFFGIKVISFEKFYLLNPDIIIVLDNSINLDNIKKDMRFSKLKAVKSDDIYKVKADYFVRPGPFLLKGLKYLNSIKL